MVEKLLGGLAHALAERGAVANAEVSAGVNNGKFASIAKAVPTIGGRSWPALHAHQFHLDCRSAGS
jgi:hypothetical protein